MEYISKEEFVKQDEKVQRVFKEYFDQEIILYFYNDLIDYGTFDDIIDEIPLLTEGQLRKFIEDKTGCKIETVWCNFGWHYNIDLVEKYDSCELAKRYYDLGEDLLQAYWKVACEIAKGNE